MKKKLLIEGMSCGHCVKHTREALEELKGVTCIDINLEGKYAIVEGDDIEEFQLKDAIDEIGYNLVQIKNMD